MDVVGGRHSALPGARSDGTTTTEVLVSLVVVSVGLLGNAALYFAGLHATDTARIRSEIVGLTQEMANRIRANPNAGAAYVTPTTSSPDSLRDCAVVGNSDTSLPRSSAEQAALDLCEWDAWIQTGISATPLRRAIALDTITAPYAYTITIEWRSKQEGARPLSYSLGVQL